MGDLLEDVVVRLPGPPTYGGDTDVAIARHRGGSAANVAAVAAALDGTARFVGHVGADLTGDRLIAALVAERVDVRATRGGRTGSIVVLVDPTGERTMLRDRGSTADLDAADLRDEVLDGVEVLHVPAYGLYEGRIAATAAALVRRAHAGGALVSVDVSSAAILERFGVAAFRALLADLRPDVLHANDVEASVLGLSVDRPPDGVGIQVITRGAEPTSVTDTEGHVRVEVPVAPVVDTTGAGDAFCAAFLCALVDGARPADAARRGHRAAAQTIATAGAGGRL